MSLIFISHNTEDKPTALHVLGRLREHGYQSLFLDSDADAGIKAGSDWEQALYRNLQMAGAVIVLCSPHSMASRWCLAEIDQARALGKSILPVKIARCDVDRFLTDRQMIDMTAVGEDEAFARLFEGLRVAGLDPADSFAWDQTRAPFPGFMAFDTDDAGVFFGRDADTRRLIDTLTRLHRQGEPRLLVLVGSSGSGKSSVVRAGVLPRIRKDEARWLIVPPFRPSQAATPLDGLRLALGRAFDEAKVDPAQRPAWVAPNADWTSLPRLEVVADQLRQATGRHEGSVLIVVDQAEELLQRTDDEAATRLLTALLPVPGTARPVGGLFVVLTLRSDFLGSFQNHPALRGVAFANVPLGPMPQEDLTQVIEGPAARAGIALDPGLVAAMVKDAHTDDALPLLAFTLRVLWDRCDKSHPKFAQAAYHDIGRIQGAVKCVVDSIRPTGGWPPATEAALRRAFLMFVQVNDEGQFIRQSARWADLPAEAAPVLQRFVSERLLRSDGDFVEVTHESLFRVWNDLKGWLDQARELLIWKRNIRDELDDWEKYHRTKDRLLPGARVGEAERWLASNRNDFSEVEVEYLSASIAAEHARRLLWKLVAGAMSALFVLAVVMAWLFNGERNKALAQAEEANRQKRNAHVEKKNAEFQRSIATEKASLAESRRLGVLADSLVTDQPDLALLLSTEAFRAHTSAESFRAQLRALQSVERVRWFLQIPKDSHTQFTFVNAVAFSPDGKTLATGGWDHQITLWDFDRQMPLGEPLRDHPNGIKVLAFSPDGKTLASGGDTGRVILWDLGTRRARDTIELGGQVTGVVFTPDGETLLACCSALRGKLLFWDVIRHRAVGEFTGDAGFASLALSPDGRWLAVGDESIAKSIILWDVAARRRLDGAIKIIKGDRTGCLAFSPDGKTLASEHRYAIILWDFETRKPREQLEMGNYEDITSLAFSPDGKTLALGLDYKKLVLLYDLVPVSPAKSAIRVAALKGHRGAVSAVIFHPNGRSLVSGGHDRSLLVWDTAPKSSLADPLDGPMGRAACVAVSPDGKTVAAGGLPDESDDKDHRQNLVVWDLATRRFRVPPEVGHHGGVLSLAFNPDRRILASAGEDHKVILWDLASLRPLGKPLLGHKGPVLSLAFSPDGKTLASGGKDRRVLLWDIATRQYRWEFIVAGAVNCLAFSRDGRLLAVPKLTSIDVWNVGTRARLFDLELPTGLPASLAFSPDGKTLASGQGQIIDNLILFDIAARRPAGEPLAGHEGMVSGVAFNPRGRILASCDWQGSVILWEAATGQPLGHPLVGPVRVTGLAFSGDGRLLATSNARLAVAGPAGPIRWNGPVTIWDVDPASWAERAARIANRNLSLAEWKQYIGPDVPYRRTSDTFPPGEGITPVEMATAGSK